MNFQEFIDKLPQEDRQLVIDHFVRNILGQGPKEGYHQTSSLIDKYKDFLTAKKAPKDKFDELYDVGKFLATLNINAKIEIPENASAIPDFIISVEKDRIGIEHTRLINVNSQIWITKGSQILKKAENIILKE